MPLEPILPRILNDIRNSAFVIADVSELSSNVFYELGYAKGLGKEVILIAKKEQICGSTSRTFPRFSGRPNGI